MQTPVVTQPARYIASDVVAAILAEAGVDAFTGDSTAIQDTFFRMAQSFELLETTMPFSTREVTPFSRDLEDALVSLELSRIIGMENPDYDRYIVKSAGREFVQEYILPLFTDEEKKQIREMAVFFAEKCPR